jgi:hypothetical protein
MNAMKWLLGVATAVTLVVPLHSANAWSNGPHGEGNPPASYRVHYRGGDHHHGYRGHHKHRGHRWHRGHRRYYGRPGYHRGHRHGYRGYAYYGPPPVRYRGPLVVAPVVPPPPLPPLPRW